MPFAWQCLVIAIYLVLFYLHVYLLPLFLSFVILRVSVCFCSELAKPLFVQCVFPCFH